MTIESPTQEQLNMIIFVGFVMIVVFIYAIAPIIIKTFAKKKEIVQTPTTQKTLPTLSKVLTQAESNDRVVRRRRRRERRNASKAQRRPGGISAGGYHG